MATSRLKSRLLRYAPFLAFALLVLVLLLSSTLSKHAPEIEGISPQIGNSGGELVISGRFFGESRNGGFVSVGGISPATSSYQWSDAEIRFTVPREMVGGIVKIMTKHGESREVVCFTNKNQLPVVVLGPQKPGEPYIARIEPNSGAVGGTVTISGLNFGLARANDSRVFFSWVAGETGGTYASADTMIAAKELDYDYVAWTDREIQVRVPDGATTGNVRVMTDKGMSNAAFFEVDDRAGTKLYDAKVSYIVQREIDLKVIRAEKDNGLYLWVPLIADRPQQRNFQPIAVEPEPFAEDYRGFMLFHLEELEQGKRYSVLYSVMYDRYAVKTRIVESRLRTSYDVSSRLYQTYTNADPLVPSSDQAVEKVAAALARGVKSPYSKAWRVYDYVVERLAYAVNPQNESVPAAIESRVGDARTYALLFSALARAAGIPARPVAGYLVSDPKKRTVQPHYWAEFYLEKVGWVPVDPVLADGLRFGDFPSGGSLKSDYFGGMDNRHIALHAGLPALKQWNPKGKTIRVEGQATFQPIHEESVGNLRAYSSNWGEVEILGVY